MPSRPSIPRRSLALLAAAGVVLTAGSAIASSGTLSGGSDAAHLVQVPGLLLGLSKATRLSDAPSDQVLTLGVGLARPNPTGEQALLTAMTTKGNPLYREFMTPSQFESKFGVAASTVSAAKAWLGSTGATVETASATGDYFTVKATVSQAEALMHVTEGVYHDVKDNSTFFANSSAPLVPSNLPVTGITGLDDVHKFSTASLTNPTPASAKAAFDKATAAAKTAATKGATGSPVFDQLLYPRDLWKLYNQPSSDMGQGETMGVFGEGETDSVIENLRFFEQSQSLPKIPVRVVRTEPGQDVDYGDNTGAVEWYLDTQAETGMAPDATRLDLYFAKTLFDADIAQDFSTWVNDPLGPTQMNASFGECEANPSNPLTGPLAQTPYGTELGDELEAVAEPILEEANLEGRTLFSSAGDTGSGCPEVAGPVAGAGNGLAIQPLPIVEYPSDSAYATGVGGTVLSENADGTRADERSWTFSGGGASHFIAQPGYQKTVSQDNIPCVSTPDGSPALTGQPCRGNPDVATLSGNATFGNGYFIYIEGAAGSEGGTSLSSPLWVGMWTRIQAAAPAGQYTDGGLGPAMNALYSQYDGQGAGGIASPKYAASFYDITESETGAGSLDAPTGGTVNAGTGNGAYQPTTGWDYASGLGSPNVSGLMTALDGTLTPTNALGFTPKYTAGGYPETGSTLVCTASENSPSGNATDPVEVSLGNVPEADLTNLAFTTSPDAKTITAVLTGSDITGAPYSQAVGIVYEVTWAYNGQTYFVKDDVEATGNTLTDGEQKSATAAEADTATPTATATFANNAVTFSIPTSDVGNPPAGAILNIPAAFTQISAQALTLTADSASAASYNTATVGQEVENGHICPAIVVPAPAPAPAPISAKPGSTKKTTASCTAQRTSSIKVYGHKSSVLNTYGQVTFTFKLFINPGKCKTPSPVGRQFYVYVDGHKSAVLRTGKGGVQTYLVRLGFGKHLVTAAFVGNKDLKKSASAKFNLRVV